MSTPSPSNFRTLSPPGPDDRDFIIWRAMYIGAFIVLGINNLDATRELAETTRSDAETERAIHVLRNNKEGDRVWPALQWLREQRQAAP
jgi:hypothetical protein